MVTTEICDSFIINLFLSLAFKEIRNAFDLFKLTPEEKSDFPENNRKREEVPPDCKVTGDHRSKENKQLLKERRNTRDETDTWAYIAADGGQEVVDSTPQADENSGRCVCSHSAERSLFCALSCLPHLPLRSHGHSDLRME